MQSVQLPQNDTINVNEIIGVIQNSNPSVVLGNVTVSLNGVNYVTYKLQKGEIPKLNIIQPQLIMSKRKVTDQLFPTGRAHKVATLGESQEGMR